VHFAQVPGMFTRKEIRTSDSCATRPRILRPDPMRANAAF